MSNQFQPPPYGHDGFTQHTPAVSPQPNTDYQQPPSEYWLPPQGASHLSPPPAAQLMAKKVIVWRWAVPASIILVVLAFLLIHWVEGTPLSGTSAPHNAGMSEQQYKDSTTTITVANLDKDGNTVSGQDVHFTATILAFVKDSNGNTAGANVSDPGTFFSSVIQVEFPSGTDITQLNTQDQIEVWGTDNGTFTGTNAFGVTVHEVGVSALYLTDHTTGYSTS